MFNGGSRRNMTAPLPLNDVINVIAGNFQGETRPDFVFSVVVLYHLVQLARSFPGKTDRNVICTIVQIGRPRKGTNKLHCNLQGQPNVPENFRAPLNFYWGGLCPVYRLGIKAVTSGFIFSVALSRSGEAVGKLWRKKLNRKPFSAELNGVNPGH
jgi:hypothetical protein